MKKRVLQEVVEDSDNTDTVMHEPLLAEEEPLLADEEPLPTPPESPFLNELDSLMPGSSPGRTPSPSPAINSKEDPKLLGPRGWIEDKSSKVGSIKAPSKPSTTTSSRPTTPSTSVATTLLAAPEGGGAPSSLGLSCYPSHQSNKNEQGSDLEIKPLQKFDSEAKAPDFAPAPVILVRNSLIAPDEEEEPRPASDVTPKAVTPKAKTPKVKTERVPSVHEPAPSTSERNKLSREGSRPPSEAETRPIPKRQPSPTPPPKPAPSQELKTVTKPVEAKAIAVKPALKAIVSSKEMITETSELEVR